ncbi:dihydrolipoamide acetyltransferase family protein [Glycomyces xiaoerkulensis]|uniref:dihydrolipoamide acetyltransferase family protein n=1 Tax=Glycomyces xiaoerkulensis TaxID=2038139 RepID=UPI000C25E3DA|nr:dihydrolipoamide acetyltransferase family protein [Glycomyces xiaoerkulensis]
MGQKITFNLPDLGEGLTEGEVAAWLVEPGGEVKLNQPFVEVETAKAVVEVPSPYTGTLSDRHASPGDTVDVGSPLATFEVEGVEERAEATTKASSEGKRTPNLVGYGAKEDAPKRRKRRREAATPPPPAPEPPVAEPVTPPVMTPPEPEPEPAPSGPALAKPPVRKLAKDLGIDLRTVAPTGPHGTVTRSDVEAAARAPAAAPGAGGEERIPIKGVRKATAQNMVASAFTAPHATVFLTCDVTGMMDAIEELKGRKEFTDVKVTPMLLVAKAVLMACRRHPMINAHWDESAGEIVVKHDVNLGIAAATPRGLVVPNIKAAQHLSLVDLAGSIGSLVRTARDGKTQPGDMSGGTISITNVGVFGVDTGTPILPPGESAILVFGAVRPQPWVHEGEIAVRQITTLGLAFDHRLIDGELGAKFLADVGDFLADPGETLLAWT